MVSLKQEQL